VNKPSISLLHLLTKIVIEVANPWAPKNLLGAGFALSKGDKAHGMPEKQQRQVFREYGQN